jgi:hypothetical protein
MINETANLTEELIDKTINNPSLMGKIADKISDLITKVTGSATQKLVESGVLVSGLTQKLISLLILFAFMFLATKISNKTFKWICIILLVLVIASILYSMFI